jgi:protein TonB
VAFEAYRKEGGRRPSRARRIMFVAAAVLHGAGIAVGVVYSYWHVDELTPPTLRVTFISASPPPPPPPPPPPAGGGAKKKVAIKTKPVETPIVQPKQPEIVQPREHKVSAKTKVRVHDDEEDDEDEGVKGGVKGGQIGGTIGGDVKNGVIGGDKNGTPGGILGGTGAAPVAVAPKILAPNMGALQKESGADPPFPPSLNHGGIEYLVMGKLCVSRTGSVDSFTIMKRADSVLDQGVVNTVKTWRFRPLTANGTAVPFCYIARFEFKSHL